MSEDASDKPAADEEKPAAPKKRSLGARVALGAVKGVLALGLVTAAVLGGAWLNVLPMGWRIRAAWTQRRVDRQMASFRAEAPKIPAGSVVILGSSTMEKMPMATLYPGAPFVNRGIGAETTPTLLARLDISLPVARPAGVVINAGANDFRADRCEARMVVTRTAAVVDAVRARFAGVPITIVEPLAQLVEEPDLLLQLAYVSEALEEYATQNGFPYVRLNRPPLITEDGTMRAEFTAGDGRHPNEAAYRIIAKWIADEGGEATAPLRASMASTR